MSITLGWFSLPVSNHSSLVWDLRTKKCKNPQLGDSPSITTSKLTWSQSQKRYHFKTNFHGIFVSFFGGMTASKRLKRPWACPPKELPFLWRQPWRGRGKGFRHGGRSNRQGRDRWLLQRRDRKHLVRRTEIVFGDFWRFFLVESWNIWQYPSVLQRGLYGRNRSGGWSVELFLCRMAAKMNIQPMVY